jgi:hypothetical protein
MNRKNRKFEVQGVQEDANPGAVQQHGTLYAADNVVAHLTLTAEKKNAYQIWVRCWDSARSETARIELSRLLLRMQPPGWASPSALGFRDLEPLVPRVARLSSALPVWTPPDLGKSDEYLTTQEVQFAGLRAGGAGWILLESPKSSWTDLTIPGLKETTDAAQAVELLRHAFAGALQPGFYQENGLGSRWCANDNGDAVLFGAWLDIRNASDDATMQRRTYAFLGLWLLLYSTPEAGLGGRAVLSAPNLYQLHCISRGAVDASIAAQLTTVYFFKCREWIGRPWDGDEKAPPGFRSPNANPCEAVGWRREGLRPARYSSSANLSSYRLHSAQRRAASDPFVCGASSTTRAMHSGWAWALRCAPRFRLMH